MITITTSIDRHMPSEAVQRAAVAIVAEGRIRHVWGDMYRVDEKYDVGFANGVGGCHCEAGDKGWLCKHLLALVIETGWMPKPVRPRPADWDPFEGIA